MFRFHKSSLTVSQCVYRRYLSRKVQLAFSNCEQWIGDACVVYFKILSLSFLWRKWRNWEKCTTAIFYCLHSHNRVHMAKRCAFRGGFSHALAPWTPHKFARLVCCKCSPSVKGKDLPVLNELSTTLWRRVGSGWGAERKTELRF